MRYAAWMLLGTAATFGLGTGALSTAAMAQSDPVVLKPSSPWNVDYGATKCRLARTFGEGRDRHALLLDQHYPGSGAGLTIAGRSFRKFRNLEETQIAFGTGLASQTGEPFLGELGRMKHALVFSSVSFGNGETGGAGETPASTVAGVRELNTAIGAKIDHLSVTQGRRTVRLETGSLAKAFEALNACTRNMVTSWGFDVEKQMSVATPPVFKNMERTAKRIQESYPSRALTRGESAIVRLRVTIDEKGEMENCVLNEATVTQTLDSPACSQMRFAEFDPAIDVNGDPIRSYFTTTITYRIN